MKKPIACAIILCGMALCLMPTLVFASTTNVLGGDVLAAQAVNISQLAFGPILKIAAIFGGLMGVVYGLVLHSVAKIVTFLGIAIGTVALPSFIDSIYGLLLT